MSKGPMAEKPDGKRIDLAPAQLEVLKTYRAWNNTPPVLGSLFARHLPRFATLAILCLITSFGLYLMGYAQWGLALLGVWIGVVLSETRRMRDVISFWPVLSSILDWGRAERAIADQLID
jgi:hypothetical protein